MFAWAILESILDGPRYDLQMIIKVSDGIAQDCCLKILEENLRFNLSQ